MTTNVLKFIGRVIPEISDVSFQSGAKVLWDIDAATRTCVQFEVVIEHSVVTVSCEYQGDIRQEHVDAMYIRAVDLTRANVDLLSFSTGLGLVVVLDHVIDRAGSKSAIWPQDSTLAPICTAYSMAGPLSQDFLGVARFVMEDPAIFMALNDLVTAISQAHCAPVNCARAVEGLRHLIAPGLGREKQWAAMRDALRLEKSYLQPIMDNSTPGRHGNRAHVSGPVVRDIVQRSWTIMNRFFEYKKRGNAPLPQPEFSTLS